MISRRIQNIWDISYNVTKLQKYIPIQKITYTPDESKSPMLRHAEAFAAVMRQGKSIGKWSAIFRKSTRQPWRL